MSHICFSLDKMSYLRNYYLFDILIEVIFNTRDVRGEADFSDDLVTISFNIIQSFFFNENTGGREHQ